MDPGVVFDGGRMGCTGQQDDQGHWGKRVWSLLPGVGYNIIMRVKFLLIYWRHRT